MRHVRDISCGLETLDSNQPSILSWLTTKWHMSNEAIVKAYFPRSNTDCAWKVVDLSQLLLSFNLYCLRSAHHWVLKFFRYSVVHWLMKRFIFDMRLVNYYLISNLREHKNKKLPIKWNGFMFKIDKPAITNCGL